MDRKLRNWSIAGVFIAFALAGGWHFIYDALPCGVLGMIAPVNESPWEHAKLFFVPALIEYLVLYLIVGKHFPNFIFAHSIPLLVMPAFMLLLYSIYQPLVGESLVANLINSLLTFAIGAWIAYRLTCAKRDFSGMPYRVAALLIVLALLTIYAVFTYSPPHYGLFWDPASHHYGLPPA